MAKIRCRDCDEWITFSYDSRTGRTIPIDIIDGRAHRCSSNYRIQQTTTNNHNVYNVYNNKTSSINNRSEPKLKEELV
jgi:hypothetical protein